MNFYKEVVPIIKKYMNRVFRAYGGDGAVIILYENNLSVDWDIDDIGNVIRVKVESDNYEMSSETEEGFKRILSMVEILSELELRHQEQRLLIDREYMKLTENLKSILN